MCNSFFLNAPMKVSMWYVRFSPIRLKSRNGLCVLCAACTQFWEFIIIASEHISRFKIKALLLMKIFQSIDQFFTVLMLDRSIPCAV